MKTDIKILDNFAFYLLSVKNLSIGTIDGYIMDLKMFFDFAIQFFNWNIDIKDIDIFFLLQIDEFTVMKFLIYLTKTKNIKSRTKQRKVSSLKMFFKWLHIKYPNMQIENLVEDFTYSEVVRLPKYLSKEDVWKLQKIFNCTNSRNALRDNTIIVVLAQCGLRLSELANLNVGDVNLTDKSINVIGKGDKERKVYLNKKALSQLELYLKTKTSLNEPLFCTIKNDRRLSIHMIEDICKKAYKLAGLEDKHYTVHTLRHTCATYMYQECKDILVVRDFLGHTSVDTTEIYVHMTDEDVKRAVENNPLANFEVGRSKKECKK